MTKRFSNIDFVEQLLSYSPRQDKGEQKAAQLIIKTLQSQGISFAIQSFPAKVPIIRQAELLADGRQIVCQGCSFTSGRIKGKDNIISSLTDAPGLMDLPNINFNPSCPGISLSYFYFAQALAVAPSSINILANANQVEGTVQVEPFLFESANILVGNTQSPKTIVIAHYDSIHTGATDNASGVTVTMDAILAGKRSLDQTLYVFSGNEELSYDQPTYWGHGFRVFEQEYKPLLKRCEKILVVDCVGNGETVINQDKNIMHLAFPIVNVKKWENKIYLCSGDIDKLMTIYHSDLDTIDQLDRKYLQEAAEMVMGKITE